MRDVGRVASTMRQPLDDLFIVLNTCGVACVAKIPRRRRVVHSSTCTESAFSREICASCGE